MTAAVYRAWSDAELALVERCARAGYNVPTIRRALLDELESDRTTHALHELTRRRGWNPKALRNAPRLAPNAAPLVFPAATLSRVVAERELEGERVDVIAPDETADEDAGAFWARVSARTRRAVAVAESEKFAVLRIESALPIALSISSDWHVSTTSAVDLDGLRDYARAVGRTPGAYALGVGDMTDNPIKHKPAAPRDVPDDLRALDMIVAEFRGRFLATTSGNHDDWTFAVAGLDSLRALMQRRRVHYAPDELVYVVEIVSPTTGDVTARYVVATRHKYRRNSTLNPLHACWRWLEEMHGQWPRDLDGRTLLPDVLAIGDNHIAEIGVQSVDRGDVIGLRMGSWQRGSGFARAFGFKNYRATAPTIVFHPTRAVQPTPFVDYATALEHLRAVRQLAALGGASTADRVLELELEHERAAV